MESAKGVLKKFSVSEAKAHLPELLRLAEQGEDVVITRHGRIVAEIRPRVSERKRLLGALKGRIWMSPDFDEPLEDFKEYME